MQLCTCKNKSSMRKFFRKKGKVKDTLAKSQSTQVEGALSKDAEPVRQARIFNYEYKERKPPLVSMSNESGGNLRSIRVNPLSGERKPIKKDNPNWYEDISELLRKSIVFIDDEEESECKYWHKKTIQSSNEPSKYEKPSKTTGNKLLEKSSPTISIGYSNTSLSMPIPLSAWQEYLNSTKDNIEEEKTRFLLSYAAGWFNTKIDEIIYGPRYDKEYSDRFINVAAKVLKNNWMQDSELANGVSIFIVTERKTSALESVGSLTFYVWIRINDNDTMKIEKTLLSTDDDTTDEKLRPQIRLVPYLCIKNVPLWMMTELGENEDPQRILRTAQLSAATKYNGKNVYIGMRIESDSDSWDDIEQVSLEVENKGFVTNEPIRPNWVNGLGLNNGLRIAHNEKEFCRQSKVLLATTPQMLALQTVLKNDVVVHAPYAVRLGRAAWHGFPQSSIDDTYSHMVGLGSVLHIKHMNNDFTTVIMRWDPKAIMRPGDPKNDNQDARKDWALAINSEWTAWI